MCSNSAPSDILRDYLKGFSAVLLYTMHAAIDELKLSQAAFELGCGIPVENIYFLGLQIYIQYV